MTFLTEYAIRHEWDLRIRVLEEIELALCFAYCRAYRRSFDERVRPDFCVGARATDAANRLPEDEHRRLVGPERSERTDDSLDRLLVLSLLLR